ncbi:GtrA family protein [Paenibacillus pini]|uniref:GtrA/DPMS transmembrane domain-containing protein n=1 Tax=Paenibacillus pini JCM 16418 TaxID=1236976 RepID=W7YEF7_9BACL|nr:GtrA family protein [Paenibacillus pini]GAF06877.1 hypothetical protein JCM16418_861 [Paenibacillus pini JCM 16418]
MRLSKQFFRFGIVGVMNTAVDFIVFLLVQPLLGSLWGQIISYSAGMLNSYVWNRRWTFERTSKRDMGEMFRFATANIAVAAVTALILHLLEGRVSLILAKLAVTVLGVLINYTLSRKWVFRQQDHTASDS